MLECEKYKLSTYKVIGVIKQTDTSTVEIVENTIDEKKYIKKTYPSDKRIIFNTLAKINNPFIPKVFEVFLGTDTIVIEEYIEGKTIEQLIDENYCFTKKEINSIFNSIVEAVDTLHSNNIIHRDIKPGNIIVRENGQAVLIDYNIARIYSNKRTEDTELLGTVGYAAPEQFGFSQTDFRSDIYALGMTMKECTNKKNMPRRLVNATRRCCEFDPAKRFQTISQLKKNLEFKKTAYTACLSLAVFAVLACMVTLFLKPQKNIVDNNIVDNNNDIKENTAIVADNHETLPPSTTQAEITPNKEIETIQKADIDETKNSTANKSPKNEKIKETPIEKPQPITKAETVDKSNDSHLTYNPTSDRIVDTSQTASNIPCLQLAGNSTYRVHIDINNNLKNVSVTATKDGNGVSITIGENTTYYCSKDTSLSTASYPNGEIFAEILFYDINNDGTTEIIPILCDAVSTKWADGETVLLKNYSLGWCIYNEAGSFKLADGRMLAEMEGFKIYSSSPECIWADFPMYYTLENGSIVKKS